MPTLADVACIGWMGAEDDMTKEEAIEWINGNRSMTNQIPQDPFETWLVRINEADAAMVQQAYWTLKAHSDNLMPPIMN